MPIYEFACGQCGHHFDHLQKLSDVDPLDCPQCGAPKLHRCVSAPTFRLAGSGWYETDFKSASDHKHHLAGDGAAASSPAPTPAPAPAPAPAASSSSSD